MPTADTISINATSAEITAYDDYTQAVSAHTIACATYPDAHPRRIECALDISRKFALFMAAAGTPFPLGPGARDDREQLCKRICTMTEQIRSAHAMLHAVLTMDIIRMRPDGVDEWEHDTSVCLTEDAMALLRHGLEVADAA